MQSASDSCVIAVDRGGLGCLNSNSASISGDSARVRLPRGTAAGWTSIER